MSKKGKLYLIPTPLSEDALFSIPEYVIQIIHHCKVFITERAKTARHFIKATNPPYAISELEVFELNKRTAAEELPTFLKAAERGQDIGLMSEAGCPGIADPGAGIVELAHRKGIEVVPLVGPSSILLALMASGMNGQSFCFHGYLPQKKPELVRELRSLEQQSKRRRQTQIFIETPYRNNAMIAQVLESLSAETFFCIAADLSLPQQYISSKKVKEWKQESLPDLHKRPAIFLIYSK